VIQSIISAALTSQQYQDGLQKVFEYDLADKIEILSLSKRPNISKNYRV